MMEFLGLPGGLLHQRLGVRLVDRPYHQAAARLNGAPPRETVTR